MGVDAPPGFVRAVLFDRDGTLIEDSPRKGDPQRVRAMSGAHEALDALRLHGIRTGVVTNQPAVGRGELTLEQVHAVNRRVDDVLGRFSTWQVCPHTPEDGCDCRKPAPGLVLAACAALDVPPTQTLVIGHTAADVGAALAAGAWPVLVPNPRTLPGEVEAAPVVAGNLVAAARIALAVAVPA
jgi:D-glycero-D-manno-heptose 1,7-bisphosphate phosphatase